MGVVATTRTTFTTIEVHINLQKGIGIGATAAFVLYEAVQLFKGK